MLKVDNISFSYGRELVLKGVTFDVAPGEIVGLVGANGSGKTTLLRVLACLMMQDSGNIVLEGTNPLLRPVRYRRGIGYLSEQMPLYPEMTVEEYLVYRVKLKGERRMRIRRRINEVVSLCDLEEVRRKRIGKLSYGNCKRVSLADALLMRPKALLLDDPLAGLDPAFRRKMAAVLTAVSVRSMIVLSGHELHDMAQWCTRFVVLSSGEVVGRYRVDEHSRTVLPGTIEELIAGESGEVEE